MPAIWDDPNISWDAPNFTWDGEEIIDGAGKIITSVTVPLRDARHATVSMVDVLATITASMRDVIFSGTILI